MDNSGRGTVGTFLMAIVIWCGVSFALGAITHPAWGGTLVFWLMGTLCWWACCDVEDWEDEKYFRHLRTWWLPVWILIKISNFLGGNGV